MSTQTINAISSKTMQVVEFVGTSVLVGMGGYIVAAITSINPVAGFVYSGTTALVAKLTEPLFKNVFDRPLSNHESKRLGLILHGACSVCAGFVATNLFVTTFTVANAVALSIFMTLGTFVFMNCCIRRY